MTAQDSTPEVVPRRIPEGTVPLISVEGTARECGREYVEIVRERYPGYRRYLDSIHAWRDLRPAVRTLFEERAPHVLELFAGMIEADEATGGTPAPAGEQGCTSFGVSGKVTLDGQPVSGQTKDTGWGSAEQYIVLRMRIQDAPSILTLAYPGEVLGYGLWSTGMSIFRNSLHAKPADNDGLQLPQLALLTLAGSSAQDAAELAKTHGLTGTGNAMISDPSGESLSLEWNAGGVSALPARDGIAVHANHPEGSETTPFEKYPDEAERENSRFRASRLRELLAEQAGRLTPQLALRALSDHAHYPLGICRHTIGGSAKLCTTAAVVVEPTRGRLHVVRGPACSNWPVTYTI